MRADTGMLGPYKQTVEVRKWNDGRKKSDGGEPDEVIVREQWFDEDGVPITDLDRVAELERKIEHDQD